MAKITGKIEANYKLIYAKQLQVNLGYYDESGILKIVDPISSAVYKDYTYEIEFDSRNLGTGYKYFLVTEFAGFRLIPIKMIYVDIGLNLITVDIVMSDTQALIEVYGKVFNSSGFVQEGVVIILYRVQLQGDVDLSKIKSDEDGKYLLRHIIAFSEIEGNINQEIFPKLGDEINIKVVADLDKYEDSEIFYDQRSALEYDIYTIDDTKRNLNDYDRKANIFKNNKEFAELDGKIIDAGIEHIDYVSGALGLSRQDAESFLLAKKEALLTGCKEEIAYALAKNNVISPKSILYNTEEYLTNTINNSIEENLIFYDTSKNSIETDLGVLIEQTKVAYVSDKEFSFKYDAVGIVDTDRKLDILNSDILWTNDIDIQNDNKSINDYLYNQEIISEKEFQKLNVFDSVLDVSETNKDLAGKILNNNNTGEWKNIDDIIREREKLLSVIKDEEAYIPGTYATAEDYYESIDKNLEKTYPSQYLKSDIVYTPKGSFLSDTQVALFLKDNPDFEFGKNHALTTLSKNGVNLDGITDVSRLEKDLQNMEQLYHIAPVEGKTDFVGALWDLGYTSPIRISETGYDEYRETVSAVLDISNDDNGLEDSYNNAVNMVGAATDVIINIDSGLGITSTNVIHGVSYDNATEAVDGFPSLRDLFGSQDHFVYPACRDLLSQAAYMMDLLQYLRSTYRGEAKINRLFDRRPDIQHILLNCSNSETLMPHIDLINEILEVALLKDVERKQISDETYKKLQTTWNEEELAAYPESMTYTPPSGQEHIKTAYNSLKGATAPWSLPFHLWLEETRIYFNQVSLKRHEFIRNFALKTGTQQLISHSESLRYSTYEYLGLSEKDVEIIIDGSVNNSYFEKYYNKISGQPGGNAEELVSLTDLNYDKISELLDSYYINPVNTNGNRYFLYTIPGYEVGNPDELTPGTLSSTFIINKDTPDYAISRPSPTEGFYVKLHRFERLRRKTGLEVYELDLILKYLNISYDISKESLIDIALVLQIKNILKLELEETLLLLGDFPVNTAYTQYTSLYNKLFLKRIEEYDYKKYFQNLINGVSVSDSSFNFSNIKTILPYISGIKISEKQYDNILANEGIASNIIVNLAGLSNIFRISYICKALSISIDEYYFLKSGCGLDNISSPGNLYTFIEYINKIKSYGLSISGLAYLLEDKNIGNNEDFLNDADVILNLRALQEQLKPVEDIFYQKNIENNLELYIKEYVDKAISYVFTDFTADDEVEIIEFTGRHPDLFSNFSDTIDNEETISLQDYFLGNGNNSNNKVKAVLAGWKILDKSKLQTDYIPKEFNSESDLRTIFNKIKTKIITEILKSSDDFAIMLNSLQDQNDRNSYIKEAYPTKADYYLGMSKNNSIRVPTGNILRKADLFTGIDKYKDPKSKSVPVAVGRINFIYEIKDPVLPIAFRRYTIDFREIVNIEDFIRNNASAFPSGTSFLYPYTDNSSYISNQTSRYKKFVYEKDMLVYNEKMNELTSGFLNYLDEDDVAPAVNIVLDFDKFKESAADTFDIKKFIEDSFGKFMPEEDAVRFLYKDTEAENPDFIINYYDRIDFVLNYLKKSLRYSNIISYFKEILNIDEEYAVKALLDYFKIPPESESALEDQSAIDSYLDKSFIDADEITEAGHKTQIDFFKRLHKLSLFIKGFNIPFDMLDDIHEILSENSDAGKFRILNIFDIDATVSDVESKLRKYLNLSEAVGLSFAYFDENHNFFNFFRNNSDLSVISQEANKEALEYLSLISGCRKPDLLELNSRVLTDDLYISWFNQLVKCKNTLDYLGVNAKTVIGLNKKDSQLNSEDSEGLRQVIKNKYSDSEWYGIAAGMRNPLRLKQRDALSQYIILKKEEFSSTNDLFSHYLIDTEMSDVPKTARLTQATLSIQLFVQRILMGLEKNSSGNETFMFRDAEIKELTWRKSYRVWEANRKMLFFPENWLEPELRQDKSEIFKSIEEKLLQIDINEDTANDIFNEYVDKLDEISNLEILCAYNTGYYDWSTYNIHLLGRTKGSTGKYYYRQLKNNNNSFTWTPWEEVANGIKADAAGLCEFRGNLYMFWPEIYTVTQLEKGKEYAYTFRETDDNESVDTTREYTAVRLAWSVYKNGKWGKAVFSNDYMVEPLNKGGLKNFILNIMRNGDTNVEIQVLFGAPKTNNFPYTKLLSRGRFIFNGNELVFKYRYDLNNGDIGTSDTNRINAMFGDHKIENNKMLCKWKDNHSFFTLYYYKEQFTSPITYDILYTENRGNIGLFKENLAIKNADYTITSSLMNVAISSWLMKPSNAVYLFKHLVLEQSRVAKSFLGIPYPSIKIVDVNNLDQNINSLKYRFVKLYHPYINEIRTTLKLGYRSIFDIAFQDSSNKSLQIEGKSFGDYYGADSIVVSPVKEALVFTNDDDKDLFYSSNDATKLKVKDAYSSYNWELFYHIPVLIANNLSNNMQFEEAQKWYHLIFDPTTGSSEPAPKRYWRIKAFRELFNSSGQLTAASNIQDIIHDINERRSAYADIVDRWEESPFNPHLIAQYRPVAYMQYVVVKYINNLINWADMLFTRDSREDINQASLLYILAAEMLGARPQKIEGTLSEPKSYKQLQSDGPDLISNVFETITGLVAVMTSGTYSSNSINFGSATYRVSYFAVPHNDNMEQYWDTVADRLFKIRHSMNIKGVYRELAITSPPIDPGMLAAALAGGADLSSAINTLSAPMPLYRFTYMLQKALEFTNDVKSLGNTMLSVLEKKDAEDMAVLRATHEKALLNAMTFIREKAVEEAQENIAALEQTRAITEARMQEYRSREEISRQENTAMIMNKTALAARDKAAMFNTLSSIIAAIPQFRASMPPAATFGGVHLVNIFNAIALNMTHISDIIQTEAREVDTKASYARRYQDWQFQAAQAEMELPQIDSQIETAKIRLLMAESELENHKLQVAQKTEEFDFIKTKFTNVQLYNWMKGQIANIYQQAYQMAHKLAIAAEKAYIFEKQKSGYDSFIKFGYWDNLKQGLMSGELLYNDLRRLELEYIENNEREPELSKDIPLSMISPDALLRLKAEGRCDFDIPEMLYDIDYPGHYMRRIKAVSISIPAVTGPYSGISCKLSLLSNRFRNTASVGNSYAYSGINDSRFIHNIIGIQSISTSTGNNDSGMFEFNFNDERYLPFEGAGATGKWQIELPDVIRKFDYETISDVILHVKYTAKDAGGLLKTAANDNIIENINKFMDEIAEEGSELQIIHSMKTEFPDEYYELEKGNSVSLKIEKKHLPFIFTNYADRQEGKSLKIFSVKCVSPDLGITAIASFDDGEVLDNSGIVIDIAPGSLNFEDGKDSYLALSYKVVG